MTVASYAGHNRKEVERALESVLRSEQFAGSRQLSDFLTFIVSKTLDGEEEQIKAYTIAVDALGRPEDFDPQTNAAVRVAAGRLRQALALHNSSKNIAGQKIKIVLEPGSYTPTFEAVGEGEASTPVKNDMPSGEGTSPLTKKPGSPIGATDVEVPASSNTSNSPSFSAGLSKFWPVFGLAAALLLALVVFWSFDATTPRPAVVSGNSEKPVLDNRPAIKTTILLPDEPYPDWFKPGEAADAVTVTIARFDDYRSFGTRTGRELQTDDPRRADYHLMITVYRRGENIRLYGKIVRERDETIVWSSERLFTPPAALSERNLPEIAGTIFSEVISPYGVIYSDLLKSTEENGKLSCVIATYQYFNRKTTQGHLTARDCAEEQIAKGSAPSSVYASLAFLYLDERRENRNPRERDPLKAADGMATMAVQLSPSSARAYQALFAVHKVQGHVDEARKAGERALALNPYDTDIIADYGAWLISIGSLESGATLLNRARELLTAPPAWQEAYRFLALELAGNSTRADEVAANMDPARSPFTAMAVIISAARTGKFDVRDAAIAELRKTDASLADFPANDLVRRGFSQEVAQRIAAKLRASGL